MKRAAVPSILVAVVLLAFRVAVDAQQPKKVQRIGYLSVSSPSAMWTRTEAFRHGLRELGYVEGKNIVIEWRSAEGKRDRLPSLVAELVRLKVDIIVTAGPPATRSAKEATVTIPIVPLRRMAILLPAGSSPALRGLGGTLLGCQPLHRS